MLLGGYQCGQDLWMDIACPCQVLYMFADLSFVLFLQEWQTLFTMLPEHEVSRGNLLATLPKLGRQWKVGKHQKTIAMYRCALISR